MASPFARTVAYTVAAALLAVTVEAAAFYVWLCWGPWPEGVSL